jgi:hypothetical protein
LPIAAEIGGKANISVATAINAQTHNGNLLKALQPQKLDLPNRTARKEKTTSINKMMLVLEISSPGKFIILRMTFGQANSGYWEHK